MSPSPNTRKFALAVASTAALACILSLLRSSKSSAGGPENNHRQLRRLSLLDPKTVAFRGPPNRFATSAQICQSPINIQPANFKSQLNEDKKILQWLHSLCGGTYIEMGALDGVKFSNSYVFNKALGWKGVLIELLPKSFEKLVVNRPDEIATIHAGVCDEPQTLHYFDTFGPLGGIYEFTAPSYREKLWHDVRLDDPAMHEIQCDTLDSLLRKNAPEVKYFDFFSLDVEGAELSVVKSVDWERVGFGVIVVEADMRDREKDMQVKQLILSKGYQLMALHGKSFYFLNSHFEEIYGRPPSQWSWGV